MRWLYLVLAQLLVPLYCIAKRSLSLSLLSLSLSLSECVYYCFVSLLALLKDTSTWYVEEGHMHVTSYLYHLWIYISCMNSIQKNNTVYSHVSMVCLIVSDLHVFHSYSEHYQFNMPWMPWVISLVQSLNHAMQLLHIGMLKCLWPSFMYFLQWTLPVRHALNAVSYFSSLTLKPCHAVAYRDYSCLYMYSDHMHVYSMSTGSGFNRLALYATFYLTWLSN